MALSALAVSLGIFASCSSASKTSSSKASRKPIFEKGEQASSSTATVEQRDFDYILPNIPDVSAIDISGAPGSLVPTARTVSREQADSLLAQFTAAFPDSLQPLARALRSVPVDSLLSVIDTLPNDIKAWLPAELSAILSGYSVGSRPADSVMTALRDSIRGAVASYRSSLPDSLQSITQDSLRSYAASQGVDITDWDILNDPDVVIETGDLLIIADTAGRRRRQNDFLEHPVFGKNTDSLVYDVKNRLIFVYREGDLTYDDVNLKGDRMIINVNTKEIYSTGIMDSLDKITRPELTQAGSVYTLDTLTYNLTSGKAKIKGVATQDGEGYLLGRDLKKMSDNTINLAHGKYTTCDHIDHPHFYIAMTKAKVIPGKKIIMGPSYFVLEDVPIYFLGIPGGFFPITSGPRAGFIMPTYGEESTRGFFLRDGGYYFTFGDYADLALTGGIYTLGSWELAARSAYILRYKLSGNLTANYARTVYGEKNSTDYHNSGNFKLAWTHRQDPKFRPGSTFSASVNFTSAGYSKQGTTNLNDHLNTQTNSSISYAKTWSDGFAPINLTASFTHSSNSRDSTIALTLPNISFSIGSFAPLKRKAAVGKQRWYEKITMSYSMQLSNSVRAKESELFSSQTLKDMSNGVSHKIPVKTSFNLFGYISFSPSFNYNEYWSFKKERTVWDPVDKRTVRLDPEFGFYRMYNYDVSGSLSTKIYGMFQIKRKPGKTGWLQAVRHVVTPTVGFSYAPDFSKARFGFTDYYQSDSLGTLQAYVAQKGAFTPGTAPGPRGAITFSLSNQIEMKVASKRDTSGVKKIPIMEQLSFSGSYNLLADSMNLSNINLTLRTGNIFKNFGIQVNAIWDPYVVIPVKSGNSTSGRRINKFNIGNGKFGRIASANWSFGYTFNSSNSGQPVMNDINSGAYVGAYSNPYDMGADIEPSLRRQYMVASYYDFSIPWNFGFNYSVNYQNNGVRTTVTQTLGFNGSVTLTEKWGVTFSGGFDIQRRKFTPGTISISRDLHCWDMSFQWVPIGTLKSWQFHIGIKSSMLKDLKYDKSSSRYDNLQE